MSWKVAHHQVEGSFEDAGRSGEERRRQTSRSGRWAVGKGSTEVEVAAEAVASAVVFRRSTGEVAAWILWNAHPREVGGSRKSLIVPLKYRSCLTGGQSRGQG